MGGDGVKKHFTLKNNKGTEIQITNYGGIITSIKVKDKNNNFIDIALGFNKLDDYLGEHPYFGAVIGERIENNDKQLKFAGGYDHNFILNKSNNNLKLAGKIESGKSGIKMDVYTTEPGVQFYTGNYLDGSIKGKSGNYNKNGGFCLETQHYPDSPYFSKFPTTVLKKGEIYRSDTVYRFFV
ncbi:MAG: hypothetical protein U9N32_00420 [Spirochaetota bacterium]|nr:hypothetical protein [Spirochaetota bacterium]